MKKRLIFILLIFFTSVLFAENIDDIFDIAKKSTKTQLAAYLEQHGFEPYNTDANNGNLYYQPKSGKSVTFYGMPMNAVIFGYYKGQNSFTTLDVSVKSKGNAVAARNAKNLIIDRYGFSYSTRANTFKNGNYSFSYSEYLDDVYGYINFSFGNW